MVTSTATANPVITGLFTNFLRNAAGFAGTTIAPLFPTSQQSASYYVYDKENYLSTPGGLERAPGTPFQRSRIKLAGDSYNCVNRGMEIPVADEERAKYASAIDADVAASNRAKGILQVNHESRVKTLSTSGSVAGASPTVKWDAYTNDSSNPILDVKTAKTAVETASGMPVTAIVMGSAVFDVLCEHPKVLDRIKYSQRGVITEEILASVFRIPLVKVAGVPDNTAAAGQDVVVGSIWDDSVILCHAENNGDLQAPNFMRTFVWSTMSGTDGVAVESYRDEPVKSDVHRANQYTDEKLTGASLGYHLSDTLT